MEDSLWPVSRRLVFALALDGSVETALDGGKGRARFTLAGKLVVLTLSHERLAFWIDGATVGLTSDAAPSTPSTALARALSSPIVVQRNRFGAIQQLGFAVSVSDDVRQTWRTLLPLLPWSTLAAERFWEREEPQAIGTARMRYYRVATHRAERTALAIRAGDAAQYTPQGTVGFAWDAAGLRTLTGHLEQRAILGEREIARSQTALSLRRLTVGALPKPLPKLPEATEPLTRAVSTATTMRTVHQGALGAATVESVLGELLAPKIKSESGLYLRLRALLTLQPDVTPRFATPLGQLPVGEPLRLLASTLGEVGTPEAQSLLRTGLERRATELAFGEVVLPALGQSPNPTAETEAFLLRLSARPDAIGRSAILLLGTVAHALIGSQPERSERLVATLIDRLEQSPTSDQQRLWLGALGNSGAASVIGPVERRLANPESPIRGEAYEALRLLPGERVDSLLVRGLRQESVASVRLRIVFALSSRPKTDASIAALRRTATTDLDTAVQTAARRALGL